MANVQDNLQAFVNAQCGFDNTFAPVALGGKTVWRFDADPNRIMPTFVRTGPMGMEAPFDLKDFRQVQAFGEGSFWMRAWVDEQLVLPKCQGHMTDLPGVPRMVPFPFGTVGLLVDIEIVVMGRLQSLVIEYDSVGAAHS